jgi:protein-S-isoprenylcysteine O-methyltransferase Ste14
MAIRASAVSVAGRLRTGTLALVVRRIPWPSVVLAAPLAVVWVFFAAANFINWQRSDQPTGLGATILELTVAVFFIMRRPAFATSRSPLAWGATALATFGGLAARPGEEPLWSLEPVYMAIQLIGVGLALASIAALGRSFGLVAANRGVRTGGPYGLIRHPLYAAYFLTLTGYVLESPTARNVAVMAAVIIFQLVRVLTEEQCLSADPAYLAYRQRVRWRMLPHVF